MGKIGFICVLQCRIDRTRNRTTVPYNKDLTPLNARQVAGRDAISQRTLSRIEVNIEVFN